MKIKKIYKKWKWLIKNTTFVQFIKYIFGKKPIVDSDKVTDLVEQKMNFVIDTNEFNKGTILIKPSGYHNREAVYRYLEKYGVKILKKVEILDYKKYAYTVFSIVKDKEQSIWYYLHNTYHKECSNQAILLYVDKSIDDIVKIKNKIRKKLGIEFYKIEENHKHYIISLTPIHSSNRNERVIEELAINNLINSNNAKIVS